MKTKRLTGRQLKKKILSLLSQADLSQALVGIGRYPHRQAVNPLFSFFYHQEELIRWRAIIAMGVVVADLATIDLEGARIVMRRLMWNLNDESGGIGWGSPEAMGEILARSPVLADEFAHILVSYIREDMNYLEHERLQQGVLWGLARLAEVRPELIQSAAPHLIPFLKSPDPVLRGLAAKIAVASGEKSLVPLLTVLEEDYAPIRIFVADRMVTSTVAEWVASIRKKMSKPK